MFFLPLRCYLVFTLPVPELQYQFHYGIHQAKAWVPSPTSHATAAIITISTKPGIYRNSAFASTVLYNCGILVPGTYLCFRAEDTVGSR